MNHRDQAIVRAAIFDVLDSGVPWVFRSTGDEIQRMEFVDEVERRVEQLQSVKVPA